MLDIEPIKGQLQAAWPAYGHREPWEARWYDAHMGSGGAYAICYASASRPPGGGARGYAHFATVYGDNPRGGCGRNWGAAGEARARLIASAPTTIAALVAEVERLRAMLDPGLAPALSN